ncbi:hypothetical protein KBTX_02797 [wastewater metagenome]|uniref:Uncharacterized protein n=2 Tax=unclassified sequences TaxID=12908 RepID=A0A5B8RBF6_9ZZZZ|nr:hypothetical protein [Arhodomonas sp. KWT]QEA06459.1 hypothetical protein KBTEX_02797 [uncultured organism]
MTEHDGRGHDVRDLTQAEIEDLRHDKKEMTKVFRRMAAERQGEHAVRDLTQSEIEALRQDKRDAIRRLNELSAKERARLPRGRRRID